MEKSQARAFIRLLAGFVLHGMPEAPALGTNHGVEPALPWLWAVPRGLRKEPGLWWQGGGMAPALEGKREERKEGKKGEREGRERWREGGRKGGGREGGGRKEKSEGERKEGRKVHMGAQ